MFLKTQRKRVEILLFIWVVTIFALYLWQFGGLVKPILGVLFPS